MDPSISRRPIGYMYTCYTQIRGCRDNTITNYGTFSSSFDVFHKL